MSAKHLQIAKFSARLAGLGLLLGALPGCQSVTGTSSVSQVRIINASPDAPGMDIYQGAGVFAYNLGFGTATSYVPIDPGVYTIGADVASTRQQLVSARGTFGANGEYTVLIGNFAANLQETVLKDQSQAAPAGQVSIRVLDQATAAGTVDVYLIASGATLLTSKPVASGISFGTNSGYLNVTAGTYTLAVLPTGTTPSSTTAALYTGTALSYPGGSARTLVLINQPLQTSPALNVIVANDFDPAGSTS